MSLKIITMFQIKEWSFMWKSFSFNWKFLPDKKFIFDSCIGNDEIYVFRGCFLNRLQSGAPHDRSFRVVRIKYSVLSPVYFFSELHIADCHSWIFHPCENEEFCIRVLFLGSMTANSRLENTVIYLLVMLSLISNIIRVKGWSYGKRNIAWLFI